MISVVIPTCKHENLVPCLESVRKYTEDTEIIVVANGYNGPLTVNVDRLIEFPDMIGYPAACNAGIEAAKGEFIVLLNDDTILLEQPKNHWLNILQAPFNDPRMAITGPWMNWCPYAEHDFLIFFCVMIRKSALNVIGMLDTNFGAGYGEDCDICCKAKEAGFKIAQVPGETKPSYDGRMALGQFPIYHAGNKTFANWPGGNELLAHNREILRQRYATNIGKAKALDGWINDEELRWLAQQARRSKVFVQIGAWHGKSSRVIADNLPVDGKMYDIDAWMGSNAELDTNHWSARLMEGDHAFNEYARGMWDHLASGKVTPLKMRGHNGAKLLLDMGIKADTVFIDGGHARGETKADIESFLPLRKEGGVICGHDYMHEDGAWPDVTVEVLDFFGPNVGHPDGTHIWYTNAPPVEPYFYDGKLRYDEFKQAIKDKRPAAVFDCFPFNNELDILEFRLKKLYPVVDRFVIVEATKTHSGKPKELVFHPNKERFSPYLHKITYIVVEDTPEIEGTVTDKSWARERHQRDAIMRGLNDCRDDDIIIISDCDEVPDSKAIQSYNGTNEIRSFDMTLYYYSWQTKAVKKWREAKIARYAKVKELTPCGIRYAQAEPISDGGVHMSYFGDVTAIIKKIENTAHVEYDVPEFKDPERIKSAIENHSDLFGRPDVEFVGE